VRSRSSSCFSSPLLTSPRFDLFSFSPHSATLLVATRLLTKSTHIYYITLRSLPRYSQILYHFSYLLPSSRNFRSLVPSTLSMTSISTLAYGLTVKATGLLSASRAWPSLIEPFRFFDLVCLRKRKGTVVSTATSTEGAVEKVPVEVWEVIRKSLVQEELESAEKRLVTEIRGPCGNEDCSVSAVDWTRTGTIAEDCDHCLDRFIGFYWEVVFGELQFFSVRLLRLNLYNRLADISSCKCSRFVHSSPRLVFRIHCLNSSTHNLAHMTISIVSHSLLYLDRAEEPVMIRLSQPMLEETVSQTNTRSLMSIFPFPRMPISASSVSFVSSTLLSSTVALVSYVLPTLIDVGSRSLNRSETLIGE